MTRNPLIRSAAMAVLVVSLGLISAEASGQEAGSRQSREFVQAAASADQFEILEAETVLAQSTSPEVRAFAMRMLQDHRQLGQAVADAAVRAGLKPPEMAMSADQAQWLGALQGGSGNEFDTLYLKQQGLAHRSVLAIEQIYAKSGDVPELRRLATSTVPLISSHGDMAYELEAKLATH